jgi:hypothetical protein
MLGAAQYHYTQHNALSPSNAKLYAMILLLKNIPRIKRHMFMPVHADSYCDRLLGTIVNSDG